MGRFLSGGGAATVPRALRQVFEASNPSFAIPTWARFMRVSGVGGGGSGGIRATTGSRGSGGGSGFHVTDLPLFIPSGVTTLAVAVGAAGAAVSAAAAVNGNAGGNTTLTLGSVLALRIDGGPAGQSNGNPPSVPNTTGVVVNPTLNVTGPITSAGFGVFGGVSPVNPYLNGSIFDASGLNSDGGFGAGNSSIFGRGGEGIAVGPTVNTNGSNASGFGAGGAGALWLSGGSVTSGAGSPGILICEFLEALQ